MDCGPVDNTCVNTACLLPEPCAPAAGSALLRELSSTAAFRIAPEEESPRTLKETRILAKGEARRGLPLEHLRARPTPHEMGLRLVCVEKPVATRPS